ncbi:MAG: HAD family hydrolase [Oscillospiraceae bacterium]|nr:HAD family hydrolase [Oscillospiraceae bacterium]
MNYPRMIIFDYGHTLLYEPDWDSVRGNAELLKYATKNPNNRTLDDVVKGAELIFGKNIENVRKIGYDISGRIGNRALYEYLGIEFSLTPLEMETVFWNGASMGAIMPDADKILDYLNEKGIRTAVISNLLWSSEALTERLNRLLPNNRFEFVMTSSDYFMRKPNRILFDVALQKARLRADEVWYCGDNPKADIEGSSQVGIYPVLYDNNTDKEHKNSSDNITLQCEYLHIHEWKELIDVLEQLA